MYLYAEQYVSGYDFTTRLEPVATLAGMGVAKIESTPAPENVVRYRQVLDLTGLADMADPNTPGVTVSVTVAYWRKSNHIHAWFVKNVQDGVDECQRAYVLPERLVELRDLCERVLHAREGDDARDVAEELLPTWSGFFFGGTEYDEYYYEDLGETIRQLERVLSHPKIGEVDLYYRSSW
jgi:hypothetical protein